MAPRPGETTVASQREMALPLEQAYELVADGDQRPLLVLRECERCKGTDHALLSRSLDNEQTVLLTHWFHCVKMPVNVLDGKHPFHNLFTRSKEGERIPHLYFCDATGANRVALPGDQAQAELWETMFGILERNYQGDAKKAVKEMRALLSQFDKVDAMDSDVRARIDHEVEKNGPGSDKIAKYEADLAKLAKERAKLVDKEKTIRALAQQDMHVAPAAKPAAAGGR